MRICESKRLNVIPGIKRGIFTNQVQYKQWVQSPLRQSELQLETFATLQPQIFSNFQICYTIPLRLIFLPLWKEKNVQTLSFLSFDHTYPEFHVDLDVALPVKQPAKRNLACHSVRRFFPCFTRIYLQCCFPTKRDVRHFAFHPDHERNEARVCFLCQLRKHVNSTRAREKEDSSALWIKSWRRFKGRKISLGSAACPFFFFA